jgi:hypothetical protein
MGIIYSRSRRRKNSIYDTTHIDTFNFVFKIKYFNILNYVSKYHDISKLKKIDELKYYIHGYENITYTCGINIIIIVIKKNNIFMATIWYSENNKAPFNISEIHTDMNENKVIMGINNFLELFENNLKRSDEMN